MCYFLYGAVNKGVDTKSYENVMRDAVYHFRIGTKHDVKLSVKDCTPAYRITDDICDCDTSVGAGDPENGTLQALETVLQRLKGIEGIKHIYLSKNWAGHINRQEKTVNINQTNLRELLANLAEDCLYTIACCS